MIPLDGLIDAIRFFDLVTLDATHSFALVSFSGMLAVFAADFAFVGIKVMDVLAGFFFVAIQGKPSGSLSVGSAIYVIGSRIILFQDFDISTSALSQLVAVGLGQVSDATIGRETPLFSTSNGLGWKLWRCFWSTGWFGCWHGCFLRIVALYISCKVILVHLDIGSHHNQVFRVVASLVNNPGCTVTYITR